MLLGLEIWRVVCLLKQQFNFNSAMFYRVTVWLFSLNALLGAQDIIPRIEGTGTGGAPTFLVDQDFEETGLPTEGDPDFWTEETVTCDWDDAIALAGSESLEAVGPALSRCTVDWTGGDIDEAWSYALVQFDDVTIVQTRAFSFRTAADSENGWMEGNATDGIFCVDGGAIDQTCWGTAISSDTTYHIFMHYKKSSGATDGVFEVGYSTDGTDPLGGDSCCTASDTHNDTDGVGIIQLRSGLNCATCGIFYDNVLIDDEAIGAQ